MALKYECIDGPEDGRIIERNDNDPIEELEEWAFPNDYNISSDKPEWYRYVADGSGKMIYKGIAKFGWQ